MLSDKKTVIKSKKRDIINHNSAASKGNKSLDSVKSDDSLTSLEWLSTMGNPTTPVLHASVYPAESQNYNIQDLISLAFRLARKQVLSLTEIADMALRLAPHLTKVTNLY